MNNGVARKASAQGDTSPRLGSVGFDDRGARGYPPGAPRWDSAAWQAAWTRARNGQGQAHILCLGDSNTLGTGSVGAEWTTAYPTIMEQYIRRVTGVTPGTGWVRPQDLAYLVDNRWVTNGNWQTGALSTGIGLGAEYWRNYNTGPWSMVFTPTEPVQSFRFIANENPATGGTITFYVDGDSKLSYAPGGAVLIRNQSFDAGGLGSHSFTVEHSIADTRSYMTAVEGVANPERGVKVSRIARWGSILNSFLGNGDNFGSTVANGKANLENLDPDLVIVAFGLNEQNSGRSVVDFTADIERAVTWFRAAGASVILMVQAPPGTSWGGGRAWDTYASCVRNAASLFNCGLIDITAAWGTNLNYPGFYYDAAHPNATGYAEIGRMAADVVLAPVL